MAKTTREEGTPAHQVTKHIESIAEGVVEGAATELAKTFKGQPELLKIALAEAGKQTKKDLKIIQKSGNTDIDFEQIALLRSIAERFENLARDGKQNRGLIRIEKLIKEEAKIQDAEKKEKTLKRSEKLVAEKKELVQKEQALIKEEEKMILSNEDLTFEQRKLIADERNRLAQEKEQQEKEQAFITQAKKDRLDYRQRILDIEEEQRQIYEESVAESEMQSRVIFDRANKSLEELIQFSKENAETIQDFSENEKDLLKEIRDLLKKSRSAAVGDLPAIAEQMAKLKGQGQIYSKQNPEFERIFNNTTKITDRVTSRVGLTSRLVERFQGGVKERIREGYNKIPMPLRFLMESATPFITNPLKRFAGFSQKQELKASEGRGQIQALQTMMEQAERGAGRSSVRSGSEHSSNRTFPLPSVGNIFTSAKSGGKGSGPTEIPELKVGKFSIGILNIQEIDEDGALENLFKKKESGGGLLDKLASFFGPIGEALASIAGFLGLKKISNVLKGGLAAAKNLITGGKVVAAGAGAAGAAGAAAKIAGAGAEAAGAAKIAGAAGGAAAGASAGSKVLATAGKFLSGLAKVGGILSVASTAFDIGSEAMSEEGYKSKTLDDFSAEDFSPMGLLSLKPVSKTGEIIGNYANQGLDAATKLFSGSGSFGGLLYEKFGGGEEQMKKALEPTQVRRVTPPPAVQQATSMTGQVAAAVTHVGGDSKASGPVIITNNNVVNNKSEGGGSLPTSMNAPRAQEPAFVRYMMRTYAQI